MSAHGIDVFNFEYWEGPPPAVAQPRFVGHTRAGASNMGLQYLGTWGEPFEVTLTSHWADMLSAVEAFRLMYLVCGTGWLFLKYANVNYTSMYNTGYHALQCEQVDLRMAGVLMGPGYAYTNGGVLVTRWTLQPEQL